MLFFRFAYNQSHWSNILIDDTGVQIADFGISRIMSKKGFTTSAPFFSSCWASFEMVQACANDVGTIYEHRTRYSDVWAFAMTVIQVRGVYEYTLY